MKFELSNVRRVALVPPADPQTIKAGLPREAVIDVRTCLLTEIDGRVSVEEELNLPDDLVSLFLTRRFWEAHETLEEVWKKTRSDFSQAIIMLLAAEIKLCKGDYLAYNKLVEMAYERGKKSVVELLIIHSALED
ncbi:MAG: DUF309 domain-containing protein [Thermoprotei archaeon]